MRRLFFCFFVVLMFQMVSTALEAKPPEIGSAALSKETKTYFLQLRRTFIKNNSLDSDVSEATNLLSKDNILKLQVTAREQLSRYAPSAVHDLKTLVMTGTDDFQTLALLSYALAERSYPDMDADLFFTLDRTLHAAKTPREKAYIHHLISKKLKKAKLPKLDKVYSKTDLKNYERKLIATYPKTFSGYDVTTSEQSHGGQACLKMSHPIGDSNTLKPQDVVEIKPKVKNASLTYQGNKICISGLAFGQDYAIKLKPGLISETGEKMTDAFEGHVFIKDRKPLVAFRERGHILQKNSEQILPVVSTNTEKVRASILSIPERNFHSVFSDYKFLSDVSHYGVLDYKNRHGEVIWDGTVDLKAETNQLTTFGIPVEKILKKKLSSGLYICQIQDADENSSRQETTSSTQWFIITDIGITTLSGNDGLTVITRSLETGQALQKAKISLFSKSNKLLHQTESDSNGIAKIGKPLLRGEESNEPLYILVHTKEDKDFNFSLINSTSHDFSDRGSTGRLISDGHEVYVYTDRGIYRPGETIHLTAMVRDDQHKADDIVPLTFVVRQPNGREYMRTGSKSPSLGVHTLTINTSKSDTSGDWFVDIFADPNAPPLASHSFMVSDFMPSLLEGEIEAESAIYSGKATQTETLNVRYLYGTKARDLKATATIRLIKSTCPFKKWESYHFGLSDHPFTSQYVDQISVTTDKKGQAKINFAIDPPTDSHDMIAVETRADVTDISGRTKKILKTTPYWYQDFALGIEAAFEGNAPYKGEASFKVIAINKEGELVEKKGLKYTLVSEETQYVWFKNGEQWRYEAVVSDTKIDSGKIDLNSTTETLLKTKVKSGPYRLIIEDPETKISSSLRFYAGWSYDDPSNARPDKVTMILDKKEYAPGDVARVTIKPPYKGDLMLFLADKKLNLFSSKSIPKEGLEVEIPLKKKGIHAPGAYLYATVFKPGATKNNKADRAIGLSWIKIDRRDYKLSVDIEVPEKVTSKSKTRAVVHLPDKPKKAFVQVMAVDEGVLQLTNYKSPDPLGFFLGNRSFNYSVIDGYSKIISSQGTKETTFKVGGGGSLEAFGAHLDIPVSAVKILSLYSGIVALDAEGKAEIPLDFPEFAGKARVMAVAWSEDKMGSSTQEIIVRDPLVTLISTPRFLSLGDQAMGSLFVHNVDGESGEYQVSTEITGPIHLTKAVPTTTTLSKDQQQKIPLNIRADDVGEASIKVTLRAPNGTEYTKTVSLGVRHNKVSESRQSYYALDPGKVFTPPADLLESFTSNPAVKISVNQFLPLPIQGMTKSLLAYPWDCLEQTISRGYAILHTGGDMKSTIDHLKSLQHFHGSFKTWPNDYRSNNWLSGYAYEFLKESGATGSFMDSANKYIKQIAYGSDNSHLSGADPSYFHYLLAKFGARNISHLRYFAHTQSKNTKLPPLAMVYIGAAFAYHGQGQLASDWFDKALQNIAKNKTYNRPFYHSALQEVTDITRIMIEVSESYPQLPKLLEQIAHLANQHRYFSTLEQASFLRLSKLLQSKETPYSIRVEGQDIITSSKAKTFEGLKNVQNAGDVPLWVTVTVTGQPKEEEKSKNAGLTLSREILTLQGEKAPEELVQGESYLVVLSGKVLDHDKHSALILDLLPAGLEVIVENVQLHNLSQEANQVVDKLSSTNHVEARDDRFMAALDLDSQSDFKVCYIARAVSSGQFSHPLSRIEDMYRPDIHAISNGDTKVVISGP